MKNKPKLVIVKNQLDESNHLVIPDIFLKMFGEQVPGTRIFEKSGTRSDYRLWYDAILELTGGNVVSPGGVAIYCPVSRAAIYKKINSGGITTLKFTVTSNGKSYSDSSDDITGRTFIEIPCCELDAWEKQLQEKRAKSSQPEIGEE